MDGNLRRRLERLERRGARPRSPAKRPRAEQAKASGLPAGEELQTPLGVAYRLESRFPLSHQHGKVALRDLLDFEPALAAEVAGDRKLRSTRLGSMAFVDLETTGLAGGTGTLGFLVGVGTFQTDGFRLRQYFLRDPNEEAAMLRSLKLELEQMEGIVSFNGRVFDLPLLEARSTIALRERWRLNEWPHFDLLYPSRRLWRRALADCRLGTLEQHILQITRAEEDVPGELIPGMYLEYLRTGDASDMRRVIYHNSVDILSLVGLASGVLDRYRRPDPAGLSGEEALAVARWHQASGRSRSAEAAYRAAVAGTGRVELRAEALRRFTTHLKRAGQLKQALAAWRSWCKLAPHDPTPCLEISKYFEWHAGSYPQALKWAEQARSSLVSWPADWRRRQAEAEIDHRIRRLRSKLGQGRR
ncbi:MAG: ribonuclease H-like domain-containing protein [Anaerolineales bacterium]